MRVRALILQTPTPAYLTWKLVTDKCLSGFLRPRGTKCIEDFATALREDRVTLSAWASTVVILHARLVEAGVTLPEELVVETLWEQLSRKEHELFGGVPSDIADFQTALERVSLANRIMPQYRKSECAAAIAERPVPRVLAPKSATKANETKKKNTGGHAWEVACALCGKNNHPTAKCWRGPDGKNKDKKEGKNSSRPTAFATVVDEPWTQQWTTLDREFSGLAGDGRRYDRFENEIFLMQH